MPEPKPVTQPPPAPGDLRLLIAEIRRYQQRVDMGPSWRRIEYARKTKQAEMDARMGEDEANAAP
ncbi:MAG: hypothetical protein M9913_09410 [Bryobacteraceae bacterium]|nr:hypothetical protein [Solibacteraceae bacterium]MCO5351101.1 hypothetical protein [Bryobacteraceae bacterium]